MTASPDLARLKHMVCVYDSTINIWPISCIGTNLNNLRKEFFSLNILSHYCPCIQRYAVKSKMFCALEFGPPRTYNVCWLLNQENYTSMAILQLTNLPVCPLWCGDSFHCVSLNCTDAARLKDKLHLCTKSMENTGLRTFKAFMWLGVLLHFRKPINQQY